ncbi:MAG: YciI family protein [Rhodobacteraceae bacterium]|nr:YciI family protein [Paracoccaceae bacterium]
MKYIALIYYDPAAAPQSGSKMNEEYFAFTRRAMEAGVMKGGDALHPPATATVVRTRHGKVETMDGPFAETKEQLGGYYVFDCADLDEAIRWVADIPGAKIGAIEVRPLVVFE